MFICWNTEGVHAYLSKCWRGTWSEKGWEPLFYSNEHSLWTRTGKIWVHAVKLRVVNKKNECIVFIIMPKRFVEYEGAENVRNILSSVSQNDWIWMWNVATQSNHERLLFGQSTFHVYFKRSAMQFIDSSLSLIGGHWNLKHHKHYWSSYITAQKSQTVLIL